MKKRNPFLLRAITNALSKGGGSATLEDIGEAVEAEIEGKVKTKALLEFLQSLPGVKKDPDDDTWVSSEEASRRKMMSRFD